MLSRIRARNDASSHVCEPHPVEPGRGRISRKRWSFWSPSCRKTARGRPRRAQHAQVEELARLAAQMVKIDIVQAPRQRSWRSRIEIWIDLAPPQAHQERPPLVH